MKAVQGQIGALGAVFLSAVAFASAAEPAVDPETGLVIDEHWELVKANCTVCHSAKLVTQMRGEREDWLEMIRWMQKTQNLWQFPRQIEAAILDYLVVHYAPKRPRFRRAPLDRSLLPPPLRLQQGAAPNRSDVHDRGVRRRRVRPLDSSGTRREQENMS